MAANKFATMLHRNKTPKIAIILIYTLLEWTLIALLLLNGLFSYLISRFACFFGLKPPCVFCSRVDHVFSRKRESYSDLVCDAHSAEISKLGYCSTHRNLAEASEMCEDCSSSRPTDDRSVAVLSWMKRSEEGEKDLRCSCCDVILESGFFSPYLLLKQSSLGVLEYTQKGKLEDDEDDNLVGEEKVEEIKERESLVVENFDGGLKVVDDESSELITPMGAGNGLLVEEERLVPVELIDSSTLIHGVEDEDDDRRDYVGYNLVEKDDTAVDLGTVSEEEEEKIGLLSTMEVNKPLDFPVVNVVEEECSLVDHQCETHESVLSSERELDAQAEEECAGVEEEKSALLSTTEINKSQDFPLVNIVEEELSLIDLQCETHQSVLSSEQELDAQEEAGCADGFGEFQVSEEVIKAIDAEANCEVSIGSEICDHEQIELPHVNELEVPQSVCANEQCSASYNVVIDKEQVTEAEPMAETIARTVDGLSVCTGMNENEDEKLPETPSSIDSLHALHKRFLFERRESGAESLDGSVASEIDGNGILTVDQLKAALRAERKALSALYMELEEERSASAIAANQTMAMITRLQEEKAAMQMEALQYQRMMEEQSEYDQEALQLLKSITVPENDGRAIRI
ncbi:uncharacterized protein A4U43_C03F14060 [Asparagus officinalis]|uniref:GTD-binding domain-containing protein n=1 Tax=Asparagus officinalis TaxID=4686 RepID=A0A5P1F9X5_ASPOF|nr:uncharacterized protein A4U43_C03F14060 [Asparagus officinalis]